MAVKLIDLQLIYGVAGAREKFEDLASQLVRGEQPDADKVRIVQGDGGIDLYVGELTGPDGIAVYQCKFFPQGIDDAQRNQIRESFARCRDSAKFAMRKWTLCLPIDLSLDEKRWFEEWRAKQASSGIVIEDPWGAMKLEGLLYQQKNQGLKEAFFQEEHLAQIREMHGLLELLLPDIAKRLRLDANERDQARLSEALAQQAKVIDQKVADMRETYLSRATQSAQKMGFPSKRPCHWEVVIHPSKLSFPPLIEKLGDCWAIAEACRVQSPGWNYPDMTLEHRDVGEDWIGSTVAYEWEEFYVESWRLHQNALFIHMFPIWDDYHQASTHQERSYGWLPDGFVPQHFLTDDVAIRTITHIFRFAKKLAEKTSPDSKGAVRIGIRLNGTRDRVLVPPGPIVREFRRATAPILEHILDYPVKDLQQPDVLAVNEAFWFFERFNSRFVTLEDLARIQARIFSRQ
jgi:hypothetical protein